MTSTNLGDLIDRSLDLDRPAIIDLRVPDAPRADEILVAVAVTDSGRPHARVGGLTTGEINGVDGLR